MSEPTDLLSIEAHARQLGYRHIAGVDEAGRGPLAGPVVAAACVIPEGVVVEGVNDSKLLTSLERDLLYAKILSIEGLQYAVGIVDNHRIDVVNILCATLQAMEEAIGGLTCRPDYLLVDGLHLPVATIPGLAVVKGDQRVQAIAAASIVAKVTRDRLMKKFHKKWPHYGFDVHKGYGTKRHIQALENYGPCPIHRLSFAPLKSLFGTCQLDFGL